MAPFNIKTIPVECRPPGYPEDFNFTPIKIEENGEERYKCPILGCFHKGSFSTTNSVYGYRLHLKTSHAHCIDLTKSTVVGETRNLIYDVQHKVLVCMEQQVIILEHQFELHKQQCTSCSTLKPSEVLVPSLDMGTDNPIQGLKRKRGIRCTHCNAICNSLQWKNHKSCEKLGFEKADTLYQEIRLGKKKRATNRAFNIQSVVPPMITIKSANEATFNHISSSASQHPAYLRNNQLLFSGYEEHDRANLVDAVLKQHEELLKCLCNIYFLSAFIALSMPIHLQFREQLRKTAHEIPFNEPFKVLTDTDVVQRYMHGFADLVLLLFRNREYHIKHGKSPLGLSASMAMKHLAFFIHDRVDCLSEAKKLKESMLKDVCDYKIPEVHHHQRNSHFNHNGIGYESITELELLDSFSLTEYNFGDHADFEKPLHMIHALWIGLALQPPNKDIPILYTTIGFYLGNAKKGSALAPLEAEYAVSGLLYCMQLVVWQELVKGGTNTSAFHVWKYGLQNFFNHNLVSLIHKLEHDVKKARNDKFFYTCCWKDIFTRDIILIEGQSLHFQKILNGFDDWIADMHLGLRGLLFELSLSQDISDAIGNTVPEYTFFEDENLLFDFIRDQGDSYASCKTMHNAINIVLQNQERANEYPELMQYCERADAFLQELLILVRLTMIDSPRSSEMRMWTYRNSQTVRSFGISHDLGFIFSSYQKNKYAQDSSGYSQTFGRIQYIPWIVTQFMAYYFSLVRPMVINIVNLVLKKPVFEHMRYKMCCNEISFWEPTVLLRKHVILTDNYFGMPITFKQWRHISELIYAELPDSLSLQNFSSSMSHTSFTAASSYALHSHRGRDVSASQVEIDRSSAMMYHSHMRLDKISEKYSMFYFQVKNEQTVRLNHFEYDVFNRPIEITNDIPDEFCDELNDGFQIFDMAKTAQVEQQSSSTHSLDPLSSTDTEVASAINWTPDGSMSPEPEVSVTSTDSIVFRNDSDSPIKTGYTSWTMIEQYKMSLCVLSGKKSFIGIMPTHSGKTMVYELPLFLEKNTGMHSIVVVSSATMKTKLRNSLEKSIKVAPDRITREEYSVFVISPDEIDMIYESARHWRACNTLKRIVFDDAHTLIKNSKWKLDPDCKLLKLGCQVIFLCSTLPKRFEDQFSLACGYPLEVIRSLTDRPNIEYRVFKSKSKWSLMFAFHEIIRMYSQVSHSGKLLICIPAEKYRREVTNLLPVDVRLNSDVLIITPHDLVYSENITHCIHWRYFTSMFEFDKALCFAGKNNQIVKSFSLFHNIDPDPKANLQVTLEMYDDFHAALLYLTGNICRREVRNQFINNTNITCRHFQGYQYCDVCKFEPTCLDTKISLINSYNVQYDVMSELIRRQLVNKGHYCLFTGGYGVSCNGCKDTRLTFKRFPWQFRNTICKSCGLNLTLGNGHLTHGSSCHYSHCMQEAVVWVYMRWMKPSSYDNYLLPDKLKSVINQSVTDIMRGERSDQQTFSKLRTSQHVKIVATALKVVYKSMFDQDVHWTK